MKKTLIVLRSLFVVLCAGGGWLLCLAVPEWEHRQLFVIGVALLVGVLTVLTDLLLKGFSLRGLTSISFGLAVGAAISFLIAKSPLFEYGDEQVIFIARLTLFIVCSYLGAVIALRSRDDFNFVIPFVKLVPHNVESPLIVLDTSALIDARIAKICESNFLSSALVVPRFVLSELQRMADSMEPMRQSRGRRGLDVLRQIRSMDHIELRVEETDAADHTDAERRLIFLCRSLKAKLLTSDVSVSKIAQIQGVRTLNLQALSKAMVKEWTAGESISVDLVKPGREEGQAIGYLEDGSMVVAADARQYVGRKVVAEITSIVPSGAGKIVFVRVMEVAT